MPKLVKKLTENSVRAACTPGYYSDGGGLYLQVSNRGTKSWVYRYTIVGRAREMGLGSLARVTLGVARQKAAEARLFREQGKDPIEARRQFKTANERQIVPTIRFRDFAEEYISSREGSWKNEKHRIQWRTSLERHAYPIIGGLGVDEIDTPQVLMVLDPIWKVVPETANRVRGRIEKILAAASVRGLRNGNPAIWKGHLKEALPARPRATPFAAMPYSQVPTFMSGLRIESGVSARALEFTILTAARTNETLGCRWLEISTLKKLWTIPAERMKAGREHYVPLPARALEVIDEMRGLRTSDNDFLFPGMKTGTSLSNMSMAAVLGRMRISNCTVHGFRSSFRDWAGDCTSFSREIAEAALAHVVRDKTEASYRRSTAVELRRRLMELWSNYCANELIDERSGILTATSFAEQESDTLSR